MDRRFLSELLKEMIKTTSSQMAYTHNPHGWTEQDNKHERISLEGQEDQFRFRRHKSTNK
jgi:hypothetical protein